MTSPVYRIGARLNSAQTMIFDVSEVASIDEAIHLVRTEVPEANVILVSVPNCGRKQP